MVGLTTGISVFAQETMTNDEVITLVQNGLNSSIVVNKIRSSKTNFDLSTDSLIKLKKAGVSDEDRQRDAFSQERNDNDTYHDGQ